MRGNILAILLTIAGMALLALCVILYTGSDRTGPEFRFSAMNLVYDQNTAETDLLTGVSAADNSDGDVSDRIVVEKVVMNETRGTAVVYYAVSDLSGNVTKQSRVFPVDKKYLEMIADKGIPESGE